MRFPSFCVSGGLIKALRTIARQGLVLFACMGAPMFTRAVAMSHATQFHSMHFLEFPQARMIIAPFALGSINVLPIEILAWAAVSLMA